MPTTTAFSKSMIARQAQYVTPSQPVPQIYDQSFTQVNYGRLCTRITNRNPDWRSLVTKRVDAGYAYRYETQSCVPSRISASVTGYGPYKGYRSWGFNRALGDTPSTFPSTDSSLQGQALQRFKRKLKQSIGGADVMAPTAELHELRGLIRQSAEFGIKTVLELARIKRTGGASALKHASDVWLMFNFGMCPLVDDTKKVLTAIAQYLQRYDKLVRKYADSNIKEWIEGINYGNTTGLYGAYYQRQYTAIHTLSYRYYGGGVMSLHSDNDYNIWDHLGLDWGALPATAWELTPYSWVFDYFTNIGPMLDDLFWSPPGQLIYSGYTRRYECNALIYRTYVPWDSNWKIENLKSATSKFRRYEFERVPLQGAIPFTEFRFKTRDEIGLNAVNKLLNLASVLIQRKL